MKNLLGLLVVGLLGVTGYSQTTVVMETFEGNVVYGDPIDKTLKLNTKYGSLNVDLDDLAQINFGVHYPSNMKEKIVNSYKDLGSSIFDKRNKASKFLVENYRYSYFFLKESRSSDAEAEKRRRDIVNEIFADKDFKYLPNESSDVFMLKNGSIFRGQTENTTFHIRNNDFDKLAVELYKIRLIKLFNKTHKTFILNSDNAYDKWFETKYIVKNKFVVTATGRLDLWPSDPTGKSVTGPKGLIGSLFNDYNGGMLLGKIGETSDPFVIGEYFENESEVSGPLFLKITRPNWIVNPKGEYIVNIR